MKTIECCDAFEEAQKSGSDNEGYGRLIDAELDGSFSIGCELPSVRFCPWCGADKQKRHPIVEAA